MAEASSIEEVERGLSSAGVAFEHVDFPRGRKAAVIPIGTEVYVVDDQKVTMRDRNTWLAMLSWMDLDEYCPLPDFSREFWAHPYTVYHATHEENVESIQREGLRPENQSRGISNRTMPAGVFTTDSPETVASYGTALFEVDIASMKRDGYMPEVVQEEPVSEARQKGMIARMCGDDDYEGEVLNDLYQEGLWEGTVVFTQGVPPRYLRLVR